MSPRQGHIEQQQLSSAEPPDVELDLETDQLSYVSSAYSLRALAELAETSWVELPTRRHIAAKVQL